MYPVHSILLEQYMYPVHSILLEQYMYPVHYIVRTVHVSFTLYC